MTARADVGKRLAGLCLYPLDLLEGLVEQMQTKHETHNN
jgi:hypothetical protein